MKKTRSIFFAAVLSTFLVGNVFASGTAGGGLFSFFSDAVSFVTSFFDDDSCPLRQCQNCRPTEGDGGGDNGNCRPRDD